MVSLSSLMERLSRLMVHLSRLIVRLSGWLGLSRLMVRLSRLMVRLPRLMVRLSRLMVRLSRLIVVPYRLMVHSLLHHCTPPLPTQNIRGKTDKKGAVTLHRCQVQGDCWEPDHCQVTGAMHHGTFTYHKTY